MTLAFQMVKRQTMLQHVVNSTFVLYLVANPKIYSKLVISMDRMIDMGFPQVFRNWNE